MNLLRDIQESDVVICIKRRSHSYKFEILKNRDGTSGDISFSDVIHLFSCYVNNLKLRHALTPILEKIKLYETFQ